MNRLVTVLLGATLLVGGCSQGELSDDPRTFYDSLDLSSPMATTETFVEAFGRDDFMTVWMSFGYFAQTDIKSAFNLLQYHQLVQVDKIPDPGITITDPISAAIGRGTVDMWWVFDQLMLVADEHDAFLVDLSNPVGLELGNTSADEATVIGEFEGMDDPVQIVLRKDQADRWLVYQVIVPNGNEEQRPWSVP